MSTFTTTAKELTDALAVVKPGVATHSAVPALYGVRVIAHYDTAVLHTTDMELAIERRIEGVSDGTLDVLVPHADLAKAAKRFKSEVTLTSEENASHADAGRGLTISDGRRSITLPGLKLDDYPSLDFLDGAPWFFAPGRELAKVIERAALFASRDETRPVLTGLYLNPDQSALVVTDSYRLGVFLLPVAKVHAKFEPANVPAGLLKIAAKSMRDADAVVLSRGPNTVTVITPAATYRMRTIAGQYPNHRQLVPEYSEPGAAELEVTMSVPELREACATATAFLRKNAPLRLSVNGKVEIHGMCPGQPSFREELPSATVVRRSGSQEEFEIGFNPEFMQDIAKIARNGSLVLSLVSPMRPGYFTDGDDGYLLMPIRLNI